MDMISQRCPKCHSSRIRAGYRPTPLWSKLLFRYHLLCDGCNWEFSGFAVPGTVSSKTKRTGRKQSEIPDINPKNTPKNTETVKDKTSDDKPLTVRKRVKVRL